MFAALVWGLGVSGLLARHSHDGHAHLHGGDIQAVADHHAGAGGHPTPATPTTGTPAPSTMAGRRRPSTYRPVMTRHTAHDAGLTAVGARPVGAHHDHDAPTLAAGASPAHRHAAHGGPIDDGADPHRHDGPHHGPVAPGDRRRRDTTTARTAALPTTTGRARDDGHSHDPGPEERPGGERRDPGEDRSGVDRLIDDVMRLVARH